MDKWEYSKEDKWIWTRNTMREQTRLLNLIIDYLKKDKKDVKENMKPLERAEYEVMTMESRMRGEETRLKQKKRRK